MKVVQCSLWSPAQDNPDMVRILIAWLEHGPKIKTGSKLTLKDSDEPERLWTIKNVGNKIIDKQKIPRTGAFFDSDI